MDGTEALVLSRSTALTLLLPPRPEGATPDSGVCPRLLPAYHGPISGNGRPSFEGQRYGQRFSRNRERKAPTAM